MLQVFDEIDSLDETESDDNEEKEPDPTTTSPHMKAATKPAILRLSDRHSIKMPARPDQNAQLIRHGSNSASPGISVKLLARKERNQKLKSPAVDTVTEDTNGKTKSESSPG